MRRKTVQVVGDPIRLDNHLAILKRKVVAYRATPRAVGEGMVALVFNASEVEAIHRVAKGEHIVGVVLTQAEAKKELRWIALGGHFPEEFEDYDEDDSA